LFLRQPRLVLVVLLCCVSVTSVRATLLLGDVDHALQAVGGLAVLRVVALSFGSVAGE
jgi:hypothetical protein